MFVKDGEVEGPHHGGGSEGLRRSDAHQRRQDRDPEMGRARSGSRALGAHREARHVGGSPAVRRVARSSSVELQSLRTNHLQDRGAGRDRRSGSHHDRPRLSEEEEVRNFFDLDQVRATPGQVVRAFRTNFGLTLKELEQITGVSYTNLSAIEHDRIDVGVRRAVLIAAAFGIEPQQILFPHGYERPEHDDAEKVRARAKRFLDKKRRAA